MSLLDILLQADLGVLENSETCTMEIPRLTEAFGQKFEVHLSAVDAERYIQLQSNMVDVGQGKTKDLDLYAYYLHLLAEGITNTEFNEPQVLTKFSAATPIDVFKKLFNAGEVTRIANKIAQLSGFDEEENDKTVEEIKN